MMAHLYKVKCKKSDCENYVEQFYGCDTCRGFNYYKKGGIYHQEIKEVKRVYHNCVNANQNIINKKDSLKKSVVVCMSQQIATLF